MSISILLADDQTRAQHEQRRCGTHVAPTASLRQRRR
jgi:hypothetical protein